MKRKILLGLLVVMAITVGLVIAEYFILGRSGTKTVQVQKVK